MTLVLRSLQLPHAFYTSMYLEVIAVLHYNDYNGDIHACVLKACNTSKYSKCISSIKRILCTNRNVYILFFFIRVFVFFSSLRCMFKSSALRVGVKTLHNTIQCRFLKEKICRCRFLVSTIIEHQTLHKYYVDHPKSNANSICIRETSQPLLFRK